MTKPAIKPALPNPLSNPLPNLLPNLRKTMTNPARWKKKTRPARIPMIVEIDSNNSGLNRSRF
jgi:hypothetical protein